MIYYVNISCKNSVAMIAMCLSNYCQRGYHETKRFIQKC